MRCPEENYSEENCPGVNCSVAENSIEGCLVAHYSVEGTRRRGTRCASDACGSDYHKPPGIENLVPSLFVERHYVPVSTSVVAHLLQSSVNHFYLDIDVVDEVSLRAIVLLENKGRASFVLEGAICPGDFDGLDFRVRGRAKGLYFRTRQRLRLIHVCLRLRRLFTVSKYQRLLSLCGRTTRILV
jgi:hypothetical protein